MNRRAAWTTRHATRCAASSAACARRAAPSFWPHTTKTWLLRWRIARVAVGAGQCARAQLRWRSHESRARSRSPDWRCFCGRSSRPDTPPAAAAVALSIGVVAVLIFVEASTRRLDARRFALLAAIAAIDAALRLVLVTGLGGFSPIFFLILAAGYVYGPSYGFLAGSVALLASAVATGGIGPWLPYEMVGCGFVGLVAGLAGLRRSGPVTWRDVVDPGGGRRGHRLRLRRPARRLGLDHLLSRSAGLRMAAGALAGHRARPVRSLLRGDVAGVRQLPRCGQCTRGDRPRCAGARRADAHAVAFQRDRPAISSAPHASAAGSPAQPDMSASTAKTIATIAPINERQLRQRPRRSPADREGDSERDRHPSSVEVVQLVGGTMTHEIEGATRGRPARRPPGAAAAGRS